MYIYIYMSSHFVLHLPRRPWIFAELTGGAEFWHRRGQSAADHDLEVQAASPVVKGTRLKGAGHSLQGML
jgi:hypothetical protein